MSQAVAASITDLFSSNRESPLRRIFSRLFTAQAADGLVHQISLIQRRIPAIIGSAPTWHPLHMKRTVERTVTEPLQALLGEARGRTAKLIRDALWELDSLGDVGQSMQVLDEVSCLLRKALTEVRR